MRAESLPPCLCRHSAAPPKPPATVDISDVECNGAVLKLERKEFLSNGNRINYSQIIVKQLEEEGQDIGTSTDQEYAAKDIIKDYENRVDGEAYITAEFDYDKGKESFTIGDEKYYSRSKSVVLALALIALACWLVRKKRRDLEVSPNTDNVEMNSAGSHGNLVNGAENHAADPNQNPMYETLHEKQATAGGAVDNPTYGESVDSGQNADYEIPDEVPRQEGDYELIKEGSGAQEGHYQQLQLNSR
ncbi:hypothetical protein OS493_012995 [Desmophyllum pertusum]|uniref:Uncharacterized protein n=1 Tax=Desmophyllum pertusum TaxID=174260 RepID=A0A9W9Z1L2_9CNID|nr:hypothetical protein OS493_012995 [Desmophyllum pertusum]